MTDLDQPDLFGEYDREQEEAARVHEWRTSPQSCPRCGTVERNGVLLGINHGIHEDGGPRFADHPGMCTAQWLTRNHIFHAVTRWEDDEAARCIDRGRTLGLDVDAIVANAKLRRPARREWLPPGHRWVCLDCPDCRHPMDKHQWRESRDTWQCVTGCKCRYTWANGLTGDPHCNMWQRDRLMKEAA